MGALTFKPAAFHFRPWELTTSTVVNHVEGKGILVFHLRGTQVQKITAPTWLQDQTRFSYDGFRRQRLTTPLVGGHPVGWSAAVVEWLSTVNQASHFVFQLDAVSSTYFFWWYRLYLAVTPNPQGTPTTVAVDTNVVCSLIFHGAYGLPGVATSTVALPMVTPYENDGVLTFPVGVPTNVATVVGQLFSAHHHGYDLGFLPVPREATPRGVTCALFQVSPLQALLQGW